MTPQDVCVVIPVFNEAAHLRQTLASVADAGQIVVVDGGSTDDTPSIAQAHHHVLFIRSDKGRGVQLAAGVQLAQRPVLLFLHGDCQLADGGLNRISQAVTQGVHWGALQQQILAPGMIYRWLEAGNALRVRLRGLPFGDQAVFVTREWYDAVGGFDPVPLMEDVQLSQRLRRKAWPTLLDAGVRVDARRWQKRGVIRQTALNWKLQWLHFSGVSAERLASLYR